MMESRLFLVLSLVGSLNALICFRSFYIALPYSLTFEFDYHMGFINASNEPDICIAVKTVELPPLLHRVIRSPQVSVFNPIPFRPVSAPLAPKPLYRPPVPIVKTPSVPNPGLPVHVASSLQTLFATQQNQQNFAKAEVSTPSPPSVRPLLKMINAPTHDTPEHVERILINLNKRARSETTLKMGALQTDVDGLLPVIDNRCYTHMNSTHITTICGCYTNNYCNLQNVTSNIYYDEADYEPTINTTTNDDDDDNYIVENYDYVENNNYVDEKGPLMITGGQDKVEAGFWSVITGTMLGKYLITMILRL